MRKTLSLMILFGLTLMCAHAETLVLHTGTRVQGTIVFQNEEVVIIRNAEGARFQYPRADVQAILSDEETGTIEETVVEEEDPEIKTSKKASILLELAGGVAIMPNDNKGGIGYSADLLVGSHHIGSKHVFVGAGVGYHGMTIDKTYNFLPIQVAVRMPFTEEKHAPVFGVGVGYGIALSKNYVGGLYAGVDFGYRCQVNPKTAVALVAFTQFQQATITVTEEPLGKGSSYVAPETGFTNKAGRSLVNAGLKFALYF